MTIVPPSMFGVPALRSEDPRLLRGRGRYVENIPLDGALRALFVRSIMPHARLLRVDLEPARRAPGVVAVLTADDLALPPMPPSGNVEGSGGSVDGVFGREVLAREVVRFVGEPFALILAESLPTAEDAGELILPEYEPLEAVIDVERAAAGDAPLLWPARGTNVANEFETNWHDDVLAGADVVVEGRFVNQRLAPVPMETNAIAVEPRPDGGVTVWVSTQIPFDVRDDIAEALGLEKARVRAIAPDVGGGFGAKLQVYPEYLAVAKAAMLVGRPVRWSETRSESMLGLTHGRGQVQYVEIGARRDGTIVGLRADLLADMGAYPIGAFLPVTTQEMLSGVYAIPKIASRGRSVVTNATPIAPYRGAGRPEATALIERAIDLVAAELDLDPAEVRRRNLIPADVFPYTTASGTTYDSGEYERALDAALRLADYGALRAEQRARRARGDHLFLGVGLCTYVEITSFASKEFASVEVRSDGGVTVLTGVTPNGQGHETAFAQMTSAMLGVPFDRVHVVHSDTGQVPRGQGTWGSRSLQAGGSAVVEQAAKVGEKAAELAAHLLETDRADIGPPQDGRFSVRGAPARSITWAELATAASDLSRLPPGMQPGLVSAGQFRQPASSFPFGTHVAVVEVDIETGDVRLMRHVAVDDCGRILNPMLVQGQVHGGLAQGIAQALFEEVRFDEQGNPMSGTLTTYAMPSAAEFPSFQTAHTETLTPTNPLGAKGVGESACIGSTPAVQNAAVDALRPLGVRHLDLPLSPERVMEAIHRATH
ncbi:MAG: xanthine dehydrogenase family protein molybdopterin-binding subunit [Actinomycetota bacterium]